MFAWLTNFRRDRRGVAAVEFAIMLPMLMALLGLAIGVFLGSLVALYFNVNGFVYPGMEELAQRFNMSERIYPSVSFLALMLGPAVVFLFCLLASIYPALRLYRLRPVEAMRAV